MHATALPHRIERFSGRTLGVATIHGKERVIGPALMRVLALADVAAIEGLDTDRFGAFTGEVQRELEPLEACRAKARHGAEVSGLDLVIASEGSFFPYPPAPFVPCDEEILVLYDARDDRFFEHRHVSLDTVFGGEACTNWNPVHAFAARMRFPEHGLVVRTKERWMPGDAMTKGITEEKELRSIAHALIAAHGSCWVETDMRAMMNPTRMRVIGEAALRFAEELAQICPVCGACWLRVIGTRSGLPCALCGWPTESIRSMERGCWHCGHTQFTPRADGKLLEEPQHCANCNP